jgi:hypothetical protein
MTDDHSIDEGRQAILAALERHQVRYVVIGGAAAQARGWPEPTDDIDVTPERSEGNLTRLAAAVEELDAGFRVDPARYPEGFRPPDGIDARTFRNQVSITFTTRHGDFDVVLIPRRHQRLRGDHHHRHPGDGARNGHRRAGRIGRDGPALQGHRRSPQGSRRHRVNVRRPRACRLTQLCGALSVSRSNERVLARCRRTPGVGRRR